MKKLAVILATWFGTGLIPPIILKGMAGTYGSLFSIPLCWELIRITTIDNNHFYFIYLSITLFIFIIGLLVVSTAENELGPRTDYKGRTKYRDQNQIVIDEVLGMLVTCTPLVLFHHTWWSYVAAFGLFRFFDIVKIPPTRYFDRQHSAFGVMMDDFVAGLYAALCLTIMIMVFNI